MKYKAQFQRSDSDVAERVEVLFEVGENELGPMPRNFIGSEAQWRRFALLQIARGLLPPGRWVELAGGVFKIIEPKPGASVIRRAASPVHETMEEVRFDWSDDAAA